MIGATALHASDFIRLPFAALSPICRDLRARLYVTTTLQHALEGLFNGPSGFIVALVPGDELPLADSAAGDQIDELQMWSQSIAILVAHKLPPTIAPYQSLYEQVGDMPPFLDLVSRICDTMRTMEMPTPATAGKWSYKGRRYVTVVAGGDKVLPVYKLEFDIEATPPYPGGSPAICPPDIGEQVDESNQPTNEGE